MSYSLSDTTAKGLLEATIDTVYCEHDHEEEGDGDPPLTLQWQSQESKLVVVCGENASGKSFLRRIVQQICHKADVECIALSVEGRRTIAYSPWLALVYGDETIDSTGANSARMVRGAITTSLERKTPHVIFLDEPDLGLSDGWAACAGRTLANFVREGSSHLQSIFVVSHNKTLVRELAAVNPNFVYVGDDRVIGSLEQWLESPPPVYSDLMDLSTMNNARFKRIDRRRRKK